MVFSFPEAPLRLVSVSIICPNSVLSTVPVVHPLSGAHVLSRPPGSWRFDRHALAFSKSSIQRCLGVLALTLSLVSRAYFSDELVGF